MQLKINNMVYLSSFLGFSFDKFVYLRKKAAANMTSVPKRLDSVSIIGSTSVSIGKNDNARGDVESGF